MDLCPLARRNTDITVEMARYQGEAIWHDESRQFLRVKYSLCSSVEQRNTMPSWFSWVQVFVGRL